MSYVRPSQRPPHENLLTALKRADPPFARATTRFALEVLGPSFFKDRPVKFWSWLLVDWDSDHGHLADDKLPWKDRMGDIDATAQVHIDALFPTAGEKPIVRVAPAPTAQEGWDELQAPSYLPKVQKAVHGTLGKGRRQETSPSQPVNVGVEHARPATMPIPVVHEQSVLESPGYQEGYGAGPGARAKVAPAKELDTTAPPEGWYPAPPLSNTQSDWPPQPQPQPQPSESMDGTVVMAPLSDEQLAGGVK